MQTYTNQNFNFKIHIIVFPTPKTLYRNGKSNGSNFTIPQIKTLENQSQTFANAKVKK